MSHHICTYCGKEIEPEVVYCPTCGTKREPEHRSCTECGKVNEKEASFCTACGSNLAEQELAAATEDQAIHHLTNSVALAPGFKGDAPAKTGAGLLTMTKGKIFIFGITVLIVAGLSYYYYLSQISNTFVEQSSQLAEKISTTNQMLESNFHSDITQGKISAITKDIQLSKEDLSKDNDKWLKVTCPDKYKSQQKLVVELVRLEDSILQQISLILGNPLSSKTDTVLQNLKKNITLAKQTADRITIPGVEAKLSGNLLVVPDKLSIYCDEQRKANEEKLKKLAAFNEFFRQMDSIIHENDSAKGDLGSALDNIRNGGYTWADYYTLIYDGRYTRESLRSQVNNLYAPPGTEALQSEISSVLTQAIQYCDLVEAGANLEYDGDYELANVKYAEARQLNSKIQKEYKAFTETYHNQKALLTNIDNM